MYHELRKRGTGLLARSLAEPGLLLWVLLAVALVVLVANPLGRIILTSVQDDATGAATLRNYIGAFGSSRHLTAFVNTLTMGGAVVLLATLLAVPLAWAVARTDMPGRELVRIAALAVFIMPPYLLAVGWILLAGPNAGWLNKLWISLTYTSAGPLNVFSFGGLVFIMASHLFFFIFVFTTAALELVSPEMEDAASILGAGVWRTARKVTLPLVVPAVLGGAILTFLQAIALFGVPALISIPARYPVMATQLWEFFEYPVRIGAAAAYSLPLIVMTAVLLGLQRWLLGRRGYVTVGGKGGVRRLVRLGWWRWPLCAWALLVIAVTLVLPFVVLLQAAFAKAWGKGWTLDNLTLANFRYVLFEHSAAQLGLANSIVYAASTAALTVLLAFGAAYVIERQLVPFGNALGFLCTVPVVIPGIVLAIGFYAAYAGPPFALYGSPLLLILAFTTRFLPIAFAGSASGLRSIHPDMEAAVRILGGGRALAIRRVMAPLLRRSLLGVAILVFVSASQELSTAIFLTGPNTQVLSVVLINMSEEGNLEALAALGALLLALTVVIVAVAWSLLGRDVLFTEPMRGGPRS